MQEMAGDEWKAFILSGPHTAKVATVRQDGRPHVVPVWFDLDGDQIVFTTWHESVKARTIQRDPRLCLCVDDERQPFAYVMIEGRASLHADLAELRRWAGRIAGRYMGQEAAARYGARNAAVGELLVRVVPTRILALRNISD